MTFSISLSQVQMCSTVVRRSYFTLRSPDISSTHPTLYTLITLLTVVPVLYFTPHHYLVTVNLFFLSLHLFWLLDGLRGLKASISPESGNFRRCPHPRFPMSFHLEVLEGGQTRGLGAGVLFKMQFVGFLAGRWQCWIQWNSVWRTSHSGPGCSASWQGVRNPLYGMTELNRARTLFLPTRPQSHCIAQKRAHFTRLQHSELWISDMSRKYHVFSNYVWIIVV